MRERTTKARIMNVIYWTLRVVGILLFVVPVGFGLYFLVCSFISDVTLLYKIGGFFAAMFAVSGLIAWVYTYADENRHERKGY